MEISLGGKHDGKQKVSHKSVSESIYHHILKLKLSHMGHIQ